MRVCALGSGSSGNALLVEGPRGPLLVDAGLPWREIVARSAKAGLSLTGLEWVIVTHEHADHVRGLDALRRRGIRVAGRPGTLRALGIEGVPLEPGYLFTAETQRTRRKSVSELNPNPKPVESSLQDSSANSASLRWIQNRANTYEPGTELGGVRVVPFAIPHDAAQPIGLRLETNGERVGIATDLGQVTDGVLSALSGCQTVVLEANHDLSMLLAGPYPWPLKLRILGPEGHLANEDAGRALRALGNGLQQVLLAHLSQENNTPALALETVARAVDGWNGRLYLTYPDRPSVVIGS